MIDRKKFRVLLISRQQQLKGELAAANDHAVELDQSRVGRLSRMDAMQMQQMDLELKRRQQRELAALDEALNRIDNGDYGECMECGELINPRRLEIDPTATLCISCAAKMER